MKEHTHSEFFSDDAALYALGVLSGAETRAFEEHLIEECATCRDELKAFAPVVEALGASAPPAAPSPRVREKLELFLQQEKRKKEAKARQAAAFISKGITIRAGEGKWKEVFKGVLVKPLFSDKERGTDTFLMRLLPGAQVPRHSHAGAEQCLVLEGDVRSNDLELRAGDYHCAPPDSVHESLETTNGALLLIVAARASSNDHAPH